jgi:formylglycine-generating enzyme required for sulfatase activity
LAAFAPDDPRWDKVQDDVAGKLAAQKPFEIARWAEVLRPMRKVLLPPLAAFLEDEKHSPTERELIANIYGNYAADVPDAYAQLEQRLAEVSAPNAPAEEKNERTKQQANLGVALLVMDHGEKVWPLLKHSPDPTLRSYLIERVGPGGVDAKVLTSRLNAESEVSTRRAILLSLGEYGLDRLAQDQRILLLPQLVQLYRDDPDPGIHEAVAWLMRRWQLQDQLKKIDQGLATGKVEGKRPWYVTGQGQTMMVIPKPRDGVFWMGEGKERHQQPLGHAFALSSEHVTVEQFQRCRAEYNPDKQIAPTKECPAIGVSWYDAAAYCNWLSQREGIPEGQWCYEINKGAVPALAASTVGLLGSPLGPRPLLAAALVFPGRTPDDYHQYGNQTKIKAGYLGLRGYRLPTEAEWEYACRVGSTVGYSFGEPMELLEKYGWFDRNSWGQTHPCGRLKPNDLGLFDMHGNVFQWTQGGLNNKPFEKEDDGGELVAGASIRVIRVIRGGSWSFDAGYCRAATRIWYTADNRVGNTGFRLARVPVEGGSK